MQWQSLVKTKREVCWNRIKLNIWKHLLTIQPQKTYGNSKHLTTVPSIYFRQTTMQNFLKKLIITLMEFVEVPGLSYPCNVQDSIHDRLFLLSPWGGNIAVQSDHVKGDHTHDRDPQNQHVASLPGLQSQSITINHKLSHNALAGKLYE